MYQELLCSIYTCFNHKSILLNYGNFQEIKNNKKKKRETGNTFLREFLQKKFSGREIDARDEKFMFFCWTILRIFFKCLFLERLHSCFYHQIHEFLKYVVKLFKCCGIGLHTYFNVLFLWYFFRISLLMYINLKTTK